MAKTKQQGQQKGREANYKSSSNVPQEQSTCLITSPVDRRLYEKKTSMGCCRCGLTKSIREFKSSQSDLFAGTGYKIPFCNSCVEEIYFHYVSKYDDLGVAEPERQAIKRVCTMLDMFYDETLYESSAKVSASGMAIIPAYIKNSNLRQHKNKTYDTTLDLKRIEIKDQNGRLQSEDDIADFNDGNEEQVTERAIALFGRGFKPEQYIYLQEQYDDWTTRHECNTKAQEELFKGLCFDQLQIFEAMRDGSTDVKDLKDTFRKDLDAAKLTPKQNASETMSDSQAFGTLIDKWETTRPLPDIDPELKDVDKIGTYIHVFFFGCLSKMAGIKNFFSATYEKYIKKYSVKKVEYEEDSDENSQVIFDRLFGNVDLDKD